MNTLSRFPLLTTIAQVGFATFLANVLLYLFQIIAGRELGPSDFSLFSALVGLIYLTGAISTAVQSTVAKNIARALWATDDENQQSMLVSSLTDSIVLGCIFLVFIVTASPLIASYIHAPTLFFVVIAGFVVFITMLVAVSQGVLQGQQRFVILTIPPLVLAVTRLSLGVGSLTLGLGVGGLLVSMTISAALALAVGLFAVRPKKSILRWSSRFTKTVKQLIPMLVGALSITLPTSADVIIVRHLYPASDAGLYAGTALFGRILIFLSLAVTAVLFPKFAGKPAPGNLPSQLLKRGMALAVLSAGPVAAVFITAPSFMLSTVLGANFVQAQSMLPFYAGAMLCFSIVIIILHYHLAVGSLRFLFILAPHIAVELAVPFVIHITVQGVAETFFFVNLSLVAMSMLFTWLTMRHPTYVERPSF